MRPLLLIVFMSLYISASMILNLNVKERQNAVDLLLNFDTPFNGTLVKKRGKDRIDILLQKVTLLAPWQKKLSSQIVYEIDATPLKNATMISFYTTTSPKLYAARSKDGYSLKLSLRSLNPATTTQIDSKTSHFFNTSLLKKIALFLVGTLIIIGVITLFMRILLREKSKVQETRRIVVEPTQTTDFKILFEKPLDEKNKVALIEHSGIQYLVIIGSTNVLLGKFKAGEIESHEEFEKAISEQDLSEAVKPQSQEDIFTTIEEYKRKASGEL